MPQSKQHENNVDNLLKNKNEEKKRSKQTTK